MLATIGDLVQDIVVHVDQPLAYGSDTSARIATRQGGSAANVARSAATAGHHARFLGQIGDDLAGNALVAELSDANVDTSFVRRSGITGSIVVVVDATGERSMLTDRRSCVALEPADPTWLDDVTTLHVPYYSLTAPPLAATTTRLIRYAHERSIAVAIDVSSAAVLESIRPTTVISQLLELEPAVVFANEHEADVLGVTGSIGDAITVIKRGPSPAITYTPDGDRTEVAAVAIDQVTDSTGAGDAFAAGFLTFPDWQRDPNAAANSGHRLAARILTARQTRNT